MFVKSARCRQHSEKNKSQDVRFSEDWFCVPVLCFLLIGRGKKFRSLESAWGNKTKATIFRNGLLFCFRCHGAFGSDQLSDRRWRLQEVAYHYRCLAGLLPRCGNHTGNHKMRQTQEYVQRQSCLHFQKWRTHARKFWQFNSFKSWKWLKTFSKLAVFCSKKRETDNKWNVNACAPIAGLCVSCEYDCFPSFFSWTRETSTTVQLRAAFGLGLHHRVHSRGSRSCRLLPGNSVAKP